MKKDERDLLEVLQAELQFLEMGGYRETARADWRPQFIFQDSPTCLNFDPARPPKHCQDCVLAQLVPEKLRTQKIACRYIPLNPLGDTIDTYYRTGTQQDLEDAVRQWLLYTIARLRRERAEAGQASRYPELHTRAKSATSR